MSKIEWTSETWNAMRGCRRKSPGCKHCYAEPTAHRLSSNPNLKVSGHYRGLTVMRDGRPAWSGESSFSPEAMAKPFSWKVGRKVFVNSMSDLFYEGFSNEQIAAVFGVMAATPQHTYQVLTKRPERMVEWFDWVFRATHPGTDKAGTCTGHAVSPTTEQTFCTGHAAATFLERAAKVPKALAVRGPWPLPNVHLGVSVEDQERAFERIPLLLHTPAVVRWVSAEPLLGPVDLAPWMNPQKVGLSWVVVGGESGAHARPCEDRWVQQIVDDCKWSRTPVFVKQLGSNACDQHGEVLKLGDRKGGDITEWPEALQVREWPAPPPDVWDAPAVPDGFEPPNPAEQVKAIGKECAQNLGRERVIAWWRAAELPRASVPAVESLRGLPAAEQFRAKAKVWLQMEVAITVLRGRGVKLMDAPPHWPQMRLTTLDNKLEDLMAKVREGAPNAEGCPFTDDEIKAMASKVNAPDAQNDRSSLCVVHYRPWLPITGADVVRAWQGPLGADLTHPPTTDSSTGLVSYRLSKHND